MRLTSVKKQRLKEDKKELMLSKERVALLSAESLRRLRQSAKIINTGNCDLPWPIDAMIVCPKCQYEFPK